jgi:hypothetical protein
LIASEPQAWIPLEHLAYQVFNIYNVDILDTH